MPSPLELRHLRTLQALVETGSLSAAAQFVHVTQSALSQQLKVLEDYFGLPLFERKSQPLRLNPAGECLLRLANVVLEHVRVAERELAKLQHGEAGQLRIAVECSTCFDWLMPAMDAFRDHWPEVELDLLSGFHQDPLPLLLENRADIAIVSERQDRADVSYQPLFAYEMVGLVGRRHAYRDKPFLQAEDFSTETLISYPVPDDLLDLVRQLLRPAGIKPQRRTTELTVGILQLVASCRGVAALPNWSVHGYIERGYVLAKRIGENGLWGELHAAIRPEPPVYLLDFLETVRTISFANLSGITPLGQVD